MVVEEEDEEEVVAASCEVGTGQVEIGYTEHSGRQDQIEAHVSESILWAVLQP